MNKGKICGLLALLLTLTLASCGGQTAPPPTETVPPQAETEPPQTEVASSQAQVEPQQAEAASSQAEAELPQTEPGGLPGEPETPPEPEQPEELLALLEQAGLELSQVEAGQLITVRSDGSSARVCGFERDSGGRWQMVLGPVEGHVGKNGVTGAKTEGDKKTPAGLFTLTLAFGVQPDPGCALPYRQVTEDSYWVDDPDSRFYNQWAEGTEEQDWNSAEHLKDYAAQYAYAAVVDYNTDPVVPGAGSAIFLHCGTRPTAGCVSVPEETMLAVLKWLSPNLRPAILIL